MGLIICLDLANSSLVCAVLRVKHWRVLTASCRHPFKGCQGFQWNPTVEGMSGLVEGCFGAEMLHPFNARVSRIIS